MPLQFYIPHRRDKEKIVLLLRRHVFIIFLKIILWALAGLMPPLFYLFFNGMINPLLANEYVYPIIVLFLSIYYLYIWLLAFHSFVDYYLDVWIVTTERIINIEQKGLFSRTVSEQELYRVQDVTSDVHGLFETFLNFGDVHIQTAGEIQRFIFKQVSDPAKITQEVVKLSEINKRHHRVMEEKEKMAIQHNS